jgi:hypothetical protein
VTKSRCIESVTDVDALERQVLESVSRAVADLCEIASNVAPFEAFRRIRFDPVGFDPLGSRRLNLIEQINQTFTYLATFEAVRILFRRHPESAPFTVNLGTAAGPDISAADGTVAAEVFAAVTPGNNRKLVKDARKVASFEAHHRYVFYSCPGSPPGDARTLANHPHIKIVSLGELLRRDAGK